MRLDYEMLIVRPFGNLKVSLCSVYVYSTLMWTIFFTHKYSPIWRIFIRHISVQLLNSNFIKYCSVMCLINTT